MGNSVAVPEQDLRTEAEQAFARLESITLHPVGACNLECGYCYQDAAVTRGEQRRPDARRWAAIACRLAGFSQRTQIKICVSGGEPMLLPAAWWQMFFDSVRQQMDSGRTVRFLVQTNGSIRGGGREEVFRAHGVDLSVHFDGLVPEPELRSAARMHNIVRWREEGFRVGCIVVGTAAALEVLAETVALFAHHGIRKFRLNHLGCEGRGAAYPASGGDLRATAEFECAFACWQHDFRVIEPAVLFKFVLHNHYRRPGSLLPPAARPQTCEAGVRMVSVFQDEAVYPCGFFPAVTGPMAEVARLPAMAPQWRETIAAWQRRQDWYDRCPPCAAFTFCQQYCGLAPLVNLPRICEAQLALFQLMEDNRALTAMIGGAFLDFLESNPGAVEGFELPARPTPGFEKPAPPA